MNGPSSAEALVLHAVLDGDEDEARRLMADFLPGELRDLREAAATLQRLTSDVLFTDGTRTDDPEGNAVRAVERGIEHPDL